MRFHYRHFTRIERGQDVCDTHFAKEQAFQTSLQRRFDWPAFLVMRKQARQSASYPHRSGEALNARNRIAAALRRSPPPPCDSFPLTDLVPGAQCFRSPSGPWRSRRSRIPAANHLIASHPTMATTQRRSNRSHIRAICVWPTHWQRCQSCLRHGRVYTNSGVGTRSGSSYDAYRLLRDAPPRAYRHRGQGDGPPFAI